MATYYKYADREASSQVNWSEITSNMVNSLKEVQTIRDSKRKAIDDATTELSTTLSDSPQGEHKGLNEFAMTYANNAQEMRLMQDQLLKSGQLKLKDYNIGRANLTQGTQKLFNISKKYQEHYKTKMDRLEGDLSATQEQWEMAEIEGFANFSNHEGYINPTNGQVSVGKLIDTKIDGKSVVTMDRTPGSFLTVDQLNFSVSDQVNKYSMENFDEQIGKFADTYLTTDGAYSSLDDVREMPGFDNMKKNIIESQLGSKRDVGSILTNYVVMAPNGKQFTFTRNPEEQDENTILLVDDSTQPGSGRSEPDFSSEIGKAHKKIAYNYLDSQLEKQLPSKQTTKAPPKATVAEIERKERMDEEDYQVSNVGKLMTGTETEIQTLTDYFRDLNPATQSVKRTSDGIVVAYRNPVTKKIETRDIPFYVGEGDSRKAKTVAQFIESASPLLTGNKDIRTILKRGNYNKDLVFNADLRRYSEGEYISRVNTKESVNEGINLEAIDSKINKKVKDLDFYGEDEGKDGLRKKIVDAFKDDFELTILPIGNDKFKINAAGYNTGDIIFEGDFNDIFRDNYEGEEERDRLKRFMRELYVQKENKKESNSTLNDGELD